MSPEAAPSILLNILEWAAVLFVLALGALALLIVVFYVIDRTQTHQAIRRNYPVIGRFRYLFEHLGEFFRQYFFAMDREELPFNRSERSWAYRAAKNVDILIIPLDGRHATFDTVFGRFRGKTLAGSFHVEDTSNIMTTLAEHELCQKP